MTRESGGKSEAGLGLAWALKPNLPARVEEMDKGPPHKALVFDIMPWFMTGGISWLAQPEGGNGSGFRVRSI
jgi:hypothetical protein